MVHVITGEWVHLVLVSEDRCSIGELGVHILLGVGGCRCSAEGVEDM